MSSPDATTTASARIVNAAMMTTLRSFVAEDRATRHLEAHADEAIVTHSGQTWAWRVAASPDAMSSALAAPWQAEIWVTEQPPARRSTAERLRALVAPHGTPVARVTADEDAVRATELAVRRELVRQVDEVERRELGRQLRELTRR